jgi:hypothetical protein
MSLRNYESGSVEDTGIHLHLSRKPPKRVALTFQLVSRELTVDDGHIDTDLSTEIKFVHEPGLGQFAPVLLVEQRVKGAAHIPVTHVITLVVGEEASEDAARRGSIPDASASCPPGDVGSKWG